jgi:hypothetical protein
MRRALLGAEILLIFVVFFVNARWPVPDGNETYYLEKAKHLWNPSWGHGVLFLDSRNAHEVFYVLVGWLSRFVSLSALAWIVRGSTWFLLAFAWQRLSFAVVPRRWWAVVTAALLVAANERASMAGEWIVGGAEAKGIAYALVFLALSRLIRNDWNRVWPLLGVAVSMHPLVGGWAFAAMALVWLSGPREPVQRPVPFLAGVLLALPGLWWALLLNAGTPPGLVHRAAEIMVFERVPHHLLPSAFPSGGMLRHLGLWILLATGMVLGRPFPAGMLRLQRVALSAMALAGLGFLLAEVTRSRPALQATLLQYYWFRLSGALVPAVLVLTIVFLVARLRTSRPAVGWAFLGVLALLGTMHLADRTRRIQSATAPRSDWMVSDPAAWQDVCAWVAAHTPSTACFLTPPGGATFQWHSGRRDVVNWKDVPQDASGILAWWDRMRDIHGPESPRGVAHARRSLGEEGGVRLRQLGDEYDADYAIIAREPGLPPLNLPEVYSNAGYLVVRLRE